MLHNNYKYFDGLEDVIIGNGQKEISYLRQTEGNYCRDEHTAEL